MKKIESLSPLQWDEIYKMRQSIYDNCAKPTDKALAVQAVEALYANANQKVPKVVFCKSPLEGVLLLVFLKFKPHRWDNLMAHLRAKFRANLEANLEDNLMDNLEANLGDNLGHDLGHNLRANLEHNLWTKLSANIADDLGLNRRVYPEGNPEDLIVEYFESDLRANLEDYLGNLRDNLEDNLENHLYASLWANFGENPLASPRDNLWMFYRDKSRLGWFLGCGVAGLNGYYELPKYRLIVENLDVIIPLSGICIVCERPVKIGWHDAGGIHCEDGPAVEYADGYKVWALEGYRVPESIVMEPEKQTLEEIHQEENEEIRRIRINRFGWNRYIQEASAKVLDIATPRYGGMEALMETSQGKVLCTYDPSTGRPYSLEVSPECRTCKDAQRYLLAPEVAFGRHGIAPEGIETYPLIRA
jgi:hypothetical protein